MKNSSGKQYLSTNYTPTFYTSYKLVKLVFSALLKSIITKNRLFIPISILPKIFKIKKDLYLSKIIYFNNQYFSTPTIPAFPSTAYNEMLKKGGLNFYDAGTNAKNQIDSVFLAITNTCKLKCEYCYERQNINRGEKINPEKWINTIKELQNKGVNIFILSGGEPLSDFESLIKILETSDKSKSDFHLHTSGHDLNTEKVKMLKKAGLKAAAVGLDDCNQESHDKIRGKGSFNNAVNALKLFNENGIFTYVNFCAGKNIINEDRLFEYFHFVKSLHVSLIQLLEPRPCGGYLGKSNIEWLNTKEKKALLEFTKTGNLNKKYKDYPLIYYVAHIEGKDKLGCLMGGLSHFYIDSKGNVCPCVFFPVSYGNILNENITLILKRMRSSIPFPIHAECPSMLLKDKFQNLFVNEHSVPFDSRLIQNCLDNIYKK